MTIEEETVKLSAGAVEDFWMDRDPNFNPVYPFPTPTLAPSTEADVPDEVLMTAYSYVKSLNR